MNLEIHTYGHIDSMFYILNGIAMLMNSSFGQTIMVTVAMISAAYYAMRISYAGTGDYKIYLGKIAGMFAMMSMLLLPTTEMGIRDHISKKREIVSNLPFGFALPVGLYEAFGDLLTTGFEQVFTPINNSNYRDYGMVFGARLVQESRNWRIRNPEFLENMSKFVDRCIVTEAMIGYHFTPQELIESDDIWHLVSNTGVIMRKTPVRRGKDYSLVSCSEAAKQILEPAFALEVENLEKRYQNVDFGLAGAVSYVGRTFDRFRPNLKKNIEFSFKNYLGVNSNAGSIIRQQMMINSLKNFSDEYGYARASATQESNWQIAGDLAGTYIPILMTVLKGLVYSSFIFLMPLLLVSGGWRRYLGYLTLVASFQLWAPLNAILNMFIDLYSSNSLSGIADNIVSFSTSSRIGNYTDKIVAVASGLQMAIPFLAFTMMQGGVHGFVHLAGTITGASQAAAAQAANESVTGNKSFDNYSVGNQQLYNQSGFKTDLNTSYAAGQKSYQHLDGSMEKVTAGGNTLMQRGAGITESVGSTNYALETSRHGQVNEGSQNALSIHEGNTRTFTNAKSDSLTKAADQISQIAQAEHSGETFNYEEMGDHSQTASNTVRHARELHEKEGYDWNQASSIAVNASVGSRVQGGVTIFGTGATVEASLSAKGEVTASNSSNQSVGESNTLSEDSGTSENYNNIMKVLSNEFWSKDNRIDQSYSEATRGSYEEVKRAEDQLSISAQKVDDWHKAQSIIESGGGSTKTEQYQHVVDGIKHDYGVDLKTANIMASNYTPEARAVWKKIQNQDHYVEDLVNKIAQDREKASGDNASKRLDGFSKDANNQISDDVSSNIKQHAKNQGLDTDNIQNNMKNKKTDLNEKFVDMKGENNQQYKESAHNSRQAEGTIKNKLGVKPHKKGESNNQEKNLEKIKLPNNISTKVET